MPTTHTAPPPDRLNWRAAIRSASKQMMDAAIAADPMSVRDIHTRAQFELNPVMDALREHRQPDARGPLQQGIQDYRRALLLDPRNVRMRLEFAGQS